MKFYHVTRYVYFHKRHMQLLTSAPNFMEGRWGGGSADPGDRLPVPPWSHNHACSSFPPPSSSPRRLWHLAHPEIGGHPWLLLISNRAASISSYAETQGLRSTRKSRGRGQDSDVNKTMAKASHLQDQGQGMPRTELAGAHRTHWNKSCSSWNSLLQHNEDSWVSSGLKEMKVIVSV